MADNNATPAGNSDSNLDNNSGSNKDVLVVDDNKINRIVAQRLLESLGYSCDMANNGRVAVEQLELTVYKVVLMDVQMPELDGFEATRLIRSTESKVLNHEIPIIALTAYVGDDDKAKCTAAGMNDYVSKPLVLEELKTKLTKYVGR